MHRPHSFTAAIASWGTARLTLGDFAPLRKRLPSWVPEGTAGHFLKYADEQTVAAVVAVDRAVEAERLDLSRQRDWPIIAAPRFLGRIAGPNVISGYDRRGPQSVSPHVIPQNSLHSISGALSILLASRGPNAGVGGGPESLDDALLAVFSLPGASAAQGCWLVATAWDPEPIADRECRLLNEPTCYAFALALQFASAARVGGELRLRVTGAGSSTNYTPRMSVAHIVGRLEQLSGTGGFRLTWPLACGAEAELSVRASEQRQRLAA
jgi:hypothetical protein